MDVATITDEQIDLELAEYFAILLPLAERPEDR